MRDRFRNLAAFARLRNRALGTTALTVVAVMAAPAAWAQTAPPAAGSLPGAFSTNRPGVSYGYTADTATGAITVDTGNNVLQWGGSTPLSHSPPLPSGLTSQNTNTGFSIGSGATLKISGIAGTRSVLVTDQTKAPSQIYGTLDASGLKFAPLFVANANDVIVGAGGVITAPRAGIGLLGYAADSAAFGDHATGGTVGSALGGTGSVTIAAGAGIGGGPLLVASNGTVNIGTTTVPAITAVVAGYSFTTVPRSVRPTVGPALADGASSVVKITPARDTTTPLTLTALRAAGAVNNSANLNVPRILSVAGLFTNDGVLNDRGGLGYNQLAGGLVNNGVLNEARGRDLVIESDSGNIQNKGVLNLASARGLVLAAANIDLEGSVQIGRAGNSQPLSSTNALAFLYLTTTAQPFPESGGVIDIATSLFTGPDLTVGGEVSSPFSVLVAGNAIRVLSGGITSAGSIILAPGTNASAVADPFYNLPSLNYTLSLFGGTQITGTTQPAAPDQPGSIIAVTNPAAGGDASFSTSPGVNLNGQLSAPTILVTANNINSNNGLAGGFALPDGGILALTFYGNVNNPNGAAANGSSSFLYNYLPVTVGANGGKPGTATISLAGPSASSTLEQNVNLLVDGNVNLANGGFGAPPPTTAALSPYANNHLVVTATGNIGFYACSCDGSQPAFYWPGLVYLTSGATAANPTAAPNATASISLVNANTDPDTGGGSVSLNNLIPADLTKPSIGGQTGHGGIFLETNNLNLAGATVTTSNDSWVNFLTPALASAFRVTSSTNFFDAAITANVVNTQPLPAADYQPQ